MESDDHFWCESICHILVISLQIELVGIWLAMGHWDLDGYTLLSSRCFKDRILFIFLSRVTQPVQKRTESIIVVIKPLYDQVKLFLLLIL
jgi:hypothetical protein